MASDMTEMPISMWTLKPTALERSLGRLMRGPDGDGHGGDAGGADAGAGDAGADAGKGAADAGADKGDAGGADKPDADDTTLMTGAKGDGDGEKGKDGGDKPDDKPAAEIPEAYTLTAEDLPEGAELDNRLLEEATPVFKETGLSNDQVKKLAPLALKVGERLMERQADEFAAIKKEWAAETLNDPELGGKNWKTTEANVARALDHFVGPKTTKGEDGTEQPNQFRKLLDDTGIGNKRELVAAFAKIGEAMSEDTNFARGDAVAKQVPREEALYPEDAPKKK